MALFLLTAACSLPPSVNLPTQTLRPILSIPSVSASATVAQPVVIREIPAQFTTPALAYETDGRAVFWSSGAPAGANATAADLWAMLPTEAEPEKIFTNPRRDSSLPIIRGDGAGHYAFVEQNQAAYGAAGWRLWYLSQAGGSPELVDQGDVDEGLLPFPALTGDRLIWSALHQTKDGVMSQLIEQQLSGGELSGGGRTILHGADARAREYLFPSIRGSLLVFTTIDPNPERTALISRVWLQDLSRGGGSVTQLSTEGTDAFMGVLGPDIVVWQDPALPSPFNGGHLVLFDLNTRTPRTLKLGRGLTTWQTVSERYIVAESEDLTEVAVYDLQTESQQVIDRASEGGEGTRQGVDVRPRVAGNLVVFVRGSDDPTVELILKWATLPGAS